MDVTITFPYTPFANGHLFNLEWMGDTCVGGWVIKGKYAKLTSNMYGVFEFIVHYLVHMVALVFFYGNVIRESKKMLQKQEDTTSANTQKVAFFSNDSEWITCSMLCCSLREESLKCN